MPEKRTEKKSNSGKPLGPIGTKVLFENEHIRVWSVELNALTRDDLRRILTDTEAALIKQYIALMATEGVTLEFTEDAIDAIADVAVLVNSSVENIGARRLQTVMERVLDEISFSATDRAGETVNVDAAYVQKHIGDLAKNTDLSRFIL